ncbi:phosphomannomutase [Devosia sp. 63-57]|uniref:phosphomannomutase n=1 Tax=Devosia sp. 63-57 TaxID=1895751 RepID=UPI000869BB76|nr:phosphomannomutase [Devosia sp. 63-57]ODT47464.1 MAG: hypothetical protein ABS74_14415 [Pelagibacterium sp. SCN 63-126]OJX42828.1 MAG: hypothetical protein BGO80_15455 [Devosia sp. 63-57]
MTNSLKFGTSGLRGLAVDLQGAEARRYTTAFITYLQGLGEAVPALYLAGDYRASTQGIIADCAAAAAEMGVPAISCGTIPTPALALHAMSAGAPSIMVTGSHIPADRNGLKFYRKSGEISKADEAGIVAALREAAPAGNYSEPVADEAEAARTRYVARYRGVLAADALKGQRIGVYEHSTVIRDILAEIFSGYGAEVVRLGRVEGFVAVDTEAFSDAVFAPLAGWIDENQLDAIISADGDADRPLLMDGQKRFVRGDVLGLLAAQFIQSYQVVTPVTSNNAIEATGFFQAVRRTRVGSPYVIAEMEKALAEGGNAVIGFEANGGTLLGSQVSVGNGLSALMTRDAVLPLLGAFGMAAREGRSVAEVVDALPLRAAVAGRLEDVAQEKSASLLKDLRDRGWAEKYFYPRVIERFAEIDGLQFWLNDGAMIHYRPSGNAPELRCYVEAADEKQADAALDWGLTAAKKDLAARG